MPDFSTETVATSHGDQSGKPFPLHANGAELAVFVDALFRDADEGTYASLRAFCDTREGPPYGIRPVLLGTNRAPLIEAARVFATEAANAPEPIVFCPPLATFSNDRQAREQDLANGLALSVEC